MDLLKLKKEIRNKRPIFLRQDSHKKKRLKGKWRKPKGTDSKIRFGIKGYRRSVKVGWRSPKKVRGKDKNGLDIKSIKSIKELDKINPKLEGVIISSKIGKKKKIELLKKAKEKGIKIINIKNVDAYIKKVEDEIKKKKEEKEKTSKEKEKKKKEAEAKAKEKKKEKSEEKIEDKIEDEESKKDEEVKKMEKVLTKK